MNVYEFQDKYSDLIDEFEKENPNRYAIWNEGFTKPFLNYLKQQRNIKINYKSKLLIPNRSSHLPYISEFWLKFIQENIFFTKKRVTDEYIIEYTPSKNECVIIKREFWNILRHLEKYGIIERYSKGTYKINKNAVMEYRKN